MNLRRRTAAIFVAALTLAVWLPTLRNDFVDWDDLLYIVTNPRFNPPTLGSVAWYWTHVAWNLYQPLTCTLWALLAWIGRVPSPDQFGGHVNPAVFHLAGVVLHTAAAVLLFAILRRAVTNHWAATAGALVFAVHPLQVEPAAFAGALNNPPFFALGLLAIDEYLAWVETRRHAHYIVGVVALVLAMLAKPAAVILPPIAFVLDLAIARRVARAALKSLAPWFLLTLPCIIWAKLAQQGSLAGAQSPT